MPSPLSIQRGPNNEPLLGGLSTVTKAFEYLSSTNGYLNVNATASISGQTIPIASATTAIAVGIVDASGNQITSFGGGTQYTDGGTPPAHPIGNALIFDSSGTWAHVSAANPLPVTGGSGGTQYQELATTSPATGTLMLGRYTSSLPTLTNGQMSEPQLDSSGRMLVTTTGTVELSTSSAVIGTVLITDGNEQANANILQGDASNSGIMTAGATKTYPFSTSSSGAQNLLSATSTAGWTWLEIIYNSIGTGLAAALQYGIGGGYATFNSFYPAGGGAMGPSGIVLNQPYYSAIHSSLFQLHISALTSGTVSGSVTLHTGPPPFESITGNITQVGGSALALGTQTAANSIPVALPTATIATLTPPTTIGTTSAPVNVGQQTVSTTAVQVSASSTVPTNGILIGALSTNSASIFVGGSGVTTSNGVELQKGAALPFTCNLNTLYIISAASTTDKIWFNVT
jgi:hypothetical protein